MSTNGPALFTSLQTNTLSASNTNGGNGVFSSLVVGDLSVTEPFGGFTISFFALNPAIPTSFIGVAGFSTVFDALQVIIPKKSLFTKLFINIQNGPEGVDTFTFQVYKNGSPVGPSKVIAEPAELKSSIEVNEPCEEGDGIAIYLELTGQIRPARVTMVAFFAFL